MRQKRVPIGKRSLVVEVADRWSFLLREALVGLGLEVVITKSVEEARSHLSSQRFDLVVQDLSLDENRQFKHGFELLKYLHSTHYPHKTPVIIVTGTASIDDAVEIVNQYPRVIYFAPKDQFHLTIIRNQFDAAVGRSLSRAPWKDHHLEKPIPQVFISKSFDPNDVEVNACFESMVTAVGLEVRTGEEYTDEAVPEKVQRIIRECDAVVGLFVGEYNTGKWQPVPPPWIVKEVEYARGIGRQTILVCEEGVNIPWKHDRDLILFSRNNLHSISAPAKRFLQALVVHRLLS